MAFHIGIPVVDKVDLDSIAIRPFQHADYPHTRIRRAFLRGAAKVEKLRLNALHVPKLGIPFYAHRIKLRAVRYIRRASRFKLFIDSFNLTTELQPRASPQLPASHDIA